MTPVLLYDGTCGLCAASVQFVLARDPGGALQFAPLDGTFGRSVIARHPELTGIDSMVWVDRESGREQVFVRSAAALKIAAYLGGPWQLARALWLVPRPLRDAAYRFIAKHRHRLTRRGEECLVPSPSDRDRFLL